MPAAYAYDQSGPRGRVISQHIPDHNLFLMGDTPLGKRKISEVAFPAAKVAWFDFFDRHSSKFEYYHAHDNASSPTAMFDGSVHARSNNEINHGFNPTRATNRAPTFYNYAPDILGFEAPTVSGNRIDRVKGKYRWTRGGLRGVDFGSDEINTGQPR